MSSDQDQDPVQQQDKTKLNGGFVTNLSVMENSQPNGKVVNKLLQNQDNFDNESQSSGTGSSTSDTDLSDKTWILRAEKDASGHNIISMREKDNKNHSKPSRSTQSRPVVKQETHSERKPPISAMTGSQHMGLGREQAEIEWTPQTEQSHLSLIHI